MSFDICRGTLGSLAMFTAIREAAGHYSRFRCQDELPEQMRLCHHVGAGAALPLSMWRSDRLKSTMRGVTTSATTRSVPYAHARHVSELPLSRRDR
jgi:hypothetical protein